MGIKTFNPYTPSRRQMTALDKKEITKHEPEKSLLSVNKKNSGRNNQGKITVRHKGQGKRRGGKDQWISLLDTSSCREQM